MGGGRSTGSSLFPLATTATIVAWVIVVVLVVGWVGRTASKGGSLEVCQWVPIGSFKVLGGMDLLI